MMLLLLPPILLSVILCMVVTSSRRASRRGSDEEVAHAAALARRNREAKERRREERFDVSRVCTASVLGQEETRTACRVIDVSKSGMRIATHDLFPIHSQVIVEWESNFFVGEVCYGFFKDGEQVYGLQLVSTNCGKGGFGR